MRIETMIFIHGNISVKKLDYSEDTFHFDIHKAAKEWVCFDCGTGIHPGERYAQANPAILSHAIPIRACLRCVPLVNEKLVELKDTLRTKQNSKVYLDAEIERLSEAIEYWKTVSPTLDI